MSYKIKMKKDDFFKIHNKIRAKDIIFESDLASFSIDRESLNVLKKTSYSYSCENSLKKKLVSFSKKYYFLGIGVLITFTMIYLNSYRINSIEFSKDTPINNEIQKKIESDYRHLWWFNFYTKNLKNLENNVKKTYIDYPFLNIEKNGSKIYVDIDSNINDDYTSFSNRGAIKAKKDGVIETALCYSGDLLVSKNKYVNKGDVLINDLGKGVSGEILAYTYNKVNIGISKKESYYEISNNKDEYYGVSFFKNDLYFGQNNKYSNSMIKENVCFNIFDIISIKKIEEIEKNAIIKEIKTLDEAKLKAKEKYENYFNENRTNNKERIIDIAYYSAKETSEEYSIILVIKALESIGELIV